MILSFILMALAVIGSVCLYIFTPLVEQPYWIWVPFILVPIFFVLGFGLVIAFAFILSLFIRPSGYVYKDKQNKFFNWILMQASFLLVHLGNASIKYSGLEKIPSDKKYLLVSNHLSNFDPIVYFSLKPHEKIICIIKTGIYKIPIASAFSYESGYIPINRKDPKEAMSTVIACKDAVKANRVSVLVYPEGTRAKDFVLKDFHPSTFKIALMSKCPVVVTAIQNSYMIAKNFPFKHTTVYFDVLDVIYPEKYENMSAYELSKYAHDLIEEHLNAHKDRMVYPKEKKK